MSSSAESSAARRCRFIAWWRWCKNRTRDKSGYCYAHRWAAASGGKR